MSGAFSIEPINLPLKSRSRGDGIKPSGIILHATAGGTAMSSIEWLRKTGNSYHFIITRDAEDSGYFIPPKKKTPTLPRILLCVPPERWAFHCSSAIPPPLALKGSLARNSVGISLANRQDGEPYTSLQLDALDWLLRELMARGEATGVEYRWLTSHALVQPWNRRDPFDLAIPKIARSVGIPFWEPSADAIAAWKPRMGG